MPVRTEAWRRAQDDPCYRHQHRRADRVLQVPRPVWPLHQSTCIPRVLYVPHVWPPRPRAPSLLPCPPQSPELCRSQACQAIGRFLHLERLPLPSSADAWPVESTSLPLRITEVREGGPGQRRGRVRLLQGQGLLLSELKINS